MTRYFDIRGDRRAGIYREGASGHIELYRREGGWTQVVLSEQDVDHLREITREEAAERRPEAVGRND